MQLGTSTMTSHRFHQASSHVSTLSLDGRNSHVLSFTCGPSRSSLVRNRWLSRRRRRRVGVRGVAGALPLARPPLPAVELVPFCLCACALNRPGTIKRSSKGRIHKQSTRWTGIGSSLKQHTFHNARLLALVKRRKHRLESNAARRRSGLAWLIVIALQQKPSRCPRLVVSISGMVTACSSHAFVLTC